MNSQAIHSALGAEGWRNVLLATGLSEHQLQNKHGPCPVCGGKDRYRFDNKRGHGDFICNRCGAGDGFKLIMGTQGVDFAQARKIAMALGGIRDESVARSFARTAQSAPEPARPTQRAISLLRESCAVQDCEAAIVYLSSRGLWPLPEGHRLRAHSSVEYWQERERIGRYPALIAPVRDGQGELVTVHVTYLEPTGLSKLAGYAPRKLLSGVSGRDGCSVQLQSPDGPSMGVAEGIETALSASALYGVPVWAALNASLLAKFTPPEHIQSLAIFADRDIAGLEAASKLMQRLQGRIRLAVHTPKVGDWNDALLMPESE